MLAWNEIAENLESSIELEKFFFFGENLLIVAGFSEVLIWTESGAI